MTDEYYLIYKTFNLSGQNILDLILNGVKSSFMPHETKKWYLRDIKHKTLEILKHDAKVNLKLI